MCCNPHQENGLFTMNGFSPLDHEWSIYYLDPNSQGCISVSSMMQLKEKAFGASVGVSCGNSG